MVAQAYLKSHLGLAIVDFTVLQYFNTDMSNKEHYIIAFETFNFSALKICMVKIWQMVIHQIFLLP